MDQQPHGLMLGFVGNDSLNKERFEALLSDLIGLHRRTYKKTGIITFLFSAEPTFSETMGQVADYAVKNNYKVGLIGHERYIKQVEESSVDADKGLRIPIQPKDSVHVAMVRQLTLQNHANLILVGDPNEDDFVFESFDAADKAGILTRSLLDDLGVVEMETPEGEEQDVTRTDEEFDNDEEFEGDEEFDDFEDSEEPEESDEEEEEEEEEEEDEPDEEALAAIEAEDEYDESEEEEPEEEEPEEEEESEDEESEEEGQEEENMAVPKKHTETSLTRLADKDWDAFIELAESLDVATGRGHRQSGIVKSILEAQGGGKSSAKTKAPAKRRAAKKAPAKKRTAPTRAAKSTAPTKRRVKQTVSANGATSSSAQVEAAVLKVLKKVTLVVKIND